MFIENSGGTMESSIYHPGLLEKYLPMEAQFEVRVALKGNATQWRVDHLVAICLNGNAARPGFHYDYGDTAFLRDTVTAEVLCAWVTIQSDCRLRDVSFDINELYPKVDLYHVPSLYRWGFLCLQVPSQQHTIQRKETRTYSGSKEMLISDGAPLFASYEEAVLELLYEYTPSRNRSERPDQYIQIIVPSTGPRFAGVRVFPTHLEIGVSGEVPERLSLHITGIEPTYHAEVKVQECGAHIVDLPLGVSGRFVCVLAKDHELLDVRHIDASLGQFFKADDVLFEHEEDATEGIQALISRGEGPTVEFKEAWPKHHETWLRTVVAFSNGQGGSLVFGVNDEGVPVGVTGDVKTFVETITKAMEDRTEPAVSAQIQPIGVGQKTLVVVKVQEGTEKPYALATQRTYRYYKRVGSTSFELRPGELQLLTRGKKGDQLKPTTT